MGIFTSQFYREYSGKFEKKQKSAATESPKLMEGEIKEIKQIAVISFCVKAPTLNAMKKF